MFLKILDDAFILGVAVGSKGVEISEQEYNDLTNMFHAKPIAREGYEYKLTKDKEWVEIPIDTNPEIDDSEALEIILGGVEL